MSEFVWKPEYDETLQNIALKALDTADEPPEWANLRDMIKHKISENTTIFLNTTSPPPAPTPFPPMGTLGGGLKLPPFPQRQFSQLTTNEPPVCYMTESEASQLKQYIFEQLDEFDAIPFTIQRVCELCTEPKKHYNSVGKYLRAVEKSLLVTSNWSSFPKTESSYDPTTQGMIMMSSAGPSAPATPLFSPIPFLHNDARRSQSRSPPPSPLVLGASAITSVEPLQVALDAPKAIGLVDELDDPSPGHMSEHPVALTAVTTVGGDKVGGVESLEDRFVRAANDDEDDEAMLIDEDKENKA